MTISQAPSAIPTTLRFMAARLVRRWRQGLPTPDADFRHAVDAALATLDVGAVRCDWRPLTPGSGWTDTGVELRAGQRCSLLADGMVHLSRAFDVGFGPKVGLWFRVGNGRVGKIVGSASTFTADSDGTLQVVTKPPGEFADRHGDFDPTQKRDPMTGAFNIAVLRWQDDGEAAIARCAAVDPTHFGPLLQRLRAPVTPPAGWHYLWRLGEGEIFHSHDHGGQHSLRCRTASDVGILQFPLDVPLTDATQLSWQWCVDRLPSALPEHIQPTHDYLSIAIEFDNGLDLTWMWSASLAEGTVFQCPLPWWDQRETHWVLRSGTQQLGQWLAERRSLLADYRAAIGGPDPQRVVGVWLIANTAFQRGVGECQYRRIVVEGDHAPVVAFA